MIQIVYCLLAASLGVLLGFLYFKSLLIGLKKLINNKSPFFLFFGFLLRIFFIGGAIFLMFKFANFIQIILFFIGFFTSMISMLAKQGFKRKKYEN
jgi:hypothetical protein